MNKTIAIGFLAAIGAFAGVIVNGQRLNAADEIRCRVNAVALVRDLAEINLKGPDEELKKLLIPKDVDADAIKKLLKAP